MTKFNPLKLLALFCAILFSNFTNAQLKDCNVFLQGNYVEVGINWTGAYGSSAASPTGYHPKGPATVQNSPACGGLCIGSADNLGFVVDPDKDGWGVGTPPYYGDMFLPGCPQEGWSIQSNKKRGNAYNAYGCSSAILDSGITAIGSSYIDSGHVKYGIWQGMFDSLQITQITRLDTSKVYFTVKVIIKNMGAIGRNNVYYMRTVDPDNDEPESGDFTTKNNIVYQNPNPSHRSLVSTWGTHYTGAYLGLGSNDSNSICFITKTGLYPDTGITGTKGLDSMYAKVDTMNLYSDSETSDVGVGLIFKIGHIPPADSTHIHCATCKASRYVDGDSAVVSYTYVFREKDVIEALNSTIPNTNGNTNAVPNITSQADIHVSPNPCRNEIMVSGLSTSDNVMIYDMLGRSMGNQWQISHDGDNTLNIDNLIPGSYIMVVTDKNGTPKARIALHKI